MKVHKVERSDNGSCNFCAPKYARAMHDSNGIFSWDYEYPYDYVYEISNNSGRGVKVRFCPDCAKDFSEKINWLEIN